MYVLKSGGLSKSGTKMRWALLGEGEGGRLRKDVMCIDAIAQRAFLIYRYRFSPSSHVPRVRERIFAFGDSALRLILGCRL